MAGGPAQEVATHCGAVDQLAEVAADEACVPECRAAAVKGLRALSQYKTAYKQMLELGLFVKAEAATSRSTSRGLGR